MNSYQTTASWNWVDTVANAGSGVNYHIVVLVEVVVIAVLFLSSFIPLTEGDRNFMRVFSILFAVFFLIQIFLFQLGAKYQRDFTLENYNLVQKL